MGRRKSLKGGGPYYVPGKVGQVVVVGNKAYFGEKGVVVDEDVYDSRVMLLDPKWGDRVITVDSLVLSEPSYWDYELAEEDGRGLPFADRLADAITRDMLRDSLKRKSKRLGSEGIEELDIPYGHKIELENVRQGWCR